MFLLKLIKMPLSTPSLSQSAQDFLHVSMNDFPEVDIQISNIESAEQKREKQTYMVRESCGFA